MRTITTATLLLLAATLGCGENIHVEEPSDCYGPCLKVDPRFHDFPNMNAGESDSVVLTLDSWGTQDVVIEDITHDGPDSLTVDDGATATTLPTGESTTLAVEYAPATDETLAVSLHILSNDEETPDLTVPLTGVGLAAVIEVDLEAHDFGDEEVGCEKARPITVRNVGSAPLTIDSVVLDGDQDEWYEEHTFEDGVALAPLDVQSISVYYTPQDETADSATLEIHSNDPATPVATVDFDGTGHFADPVQDEYIQHAAAWVDILWVIDNTETMGPYQDQLITEAVKGFPELQAELTAQGVEHFHVAVVTTDAPEMSGTPPILTSATPNLMDLFINNAQVGVDGAWYARGLDYALQALTSPMTDVGGPNEGFLRDAAALRVIVLSDAEDGSNGGVLGYVQDLQALEPDPDFLKIAAITGGDKGCKGPLGTADPAPRYAQAVSYSDGLAISICDSDWFGALATMAWLSPTAAGTFVLQQDPIEGTVTVAVNGTPLTSGWVYDAKHNAVVFEASTLPELNDTITIGYTPVGSCG